jgi:uncharacterized protein (TIGR02271 family)
MAHRREPGKEEGLRGREDLHGREELRDRENLRGNEEDELRVQRTEEELAAGTREREAGEVRVNKRVRTDREQVRVPTRHEEVSVERVPVEGREASEAEIGEDEVYMPVVEDEVVVEKRPEVKEEIRVRKDAVQEEELIEEDVRKEEVDVEDQTQRLAERAEHHRRTGEGKTDRATAGEAGRPAEAERAGREETEKEDFIEKAKRKLQGQ